MTNNRFLLSLRRGALWFLLLSLPAVATAQLPIGDESDELTAKLINMPNIEVGKGISFMPTDSLFKLNIRFRMQNMVGLFFRDDMSLERSDMMIKRLRLRFEGYMFTPKLSYTLQLGFSPYDTKSSSSNDVLNVIRDAMIYYIPSSSFNIGFGQTKIPANRARINSSSALQFVDRSIVNSTFQVDRDFGVFAAYNWRLFSQVNAVTKASVTSGHGRNYNSIQNVGMAYTGRMELYPFGRFKSMGDLFEGDFEREAKPKLMIAGAYSYNNKTANIEGQRGEVIFNNETRNIANYFVDLIFKYRGFAFYTDFMGRFTPQSAVVTDNASGNTQYMYAGKGVNVQASYIFPSNWEVALRNSTLLPDEEIQPYVKYESFNQTTIGITKYLIGHSLKVQVDASYNHKTMLDPAAMRNDYELRFQVELGI